MQETELKALIDKCLAGMATAREQQQLDEWYQEFEARKGLTEQLNEEERVGTGNRMLSGITSSIDAEVSRRENLFIPARVLLAAASVMMIVFFFWIYKSAEKDPKVPDAAWIVWKAPAGEISKKLLPDGSQVWINAGSTIRYAENFLAKERDLWLDGEAYFEVDRQPEHPFKVHTGEVVTTVLGTKFNVAATSSAAKVVVTVAEGMVSVGKVSQVIRVLERNDQLLIETSNGRATFSHVSAVTAVAWKNEALVFKEKPFREIAAILEQRFDVTIGFSNPGIQDCLLTASFSKERSALEILSMLSKVNGFQLKSGKKLYIISGKPCKN